MKKMFIPCNNGFDGANWIKYSNKFTQTRKLVMAGALGLKKLVEITDDDMKLVDRNPDVVILASKLDEFTGDIQKVPESSDPSYESIIEGNASAIVKFIKSNAVKCLGDIIEQSQVDVLCSPKTFDTVKYSVLIDSWADMWAAFNPNFLRAVSLKTQYKVTLRDQFSGLTELDAKDVEAIENEIRKISYLKGEFSNKTSKREYILFTTKKGKLEDIKEFEEIISKASPLSRIVNLTIEDIPTKLIFSELLLFKKTKLVSDRLKLQDKVTSIKNGWIKLAKAASQSGTVFDLDKLLRKK